MKRENVETAPSQLTAYELAAPQIETLITYSQKQVADAIRHLSHDQVDLWRQLPYWTVMAKGRKGYYDHVAQFTYRHGLHRVGGASELGASSHYVDCETGNIVFVERLDQIDLSKLANDWQVVGLWNPESDKFNAQAQVDYYRALASQPVPENRPPMWLDETWEEQYDTC